MASAQFPFTIRDGRLRVAATTLDAEVARAVVSGGYDIPADQADIRATVALAAVGQTTSRPEIQVFATGSPDALDRTVDVSALSSWLAVRAIDRETRRLDSIERGETPAAVTPTSIPPEVAQPPVAAPDATQPSQPSSEAPLSGRDPRRFQPKPKVSAPRPLAAPSVTNAPVVSQQVPPLPPPIEVRPAPGVTARPPKPKPPLVLMPPVANP
ncbi:hypothetical protein GALL_437800 [mine drainage metagenome]|uniref:Uncharacterized protein n=1 Tax=mine drainage metagenome TaxID=410659 RepID=A0A1J5PSU5_9ZZZZ